jgi:shikimate kinase/3-dehydroquinate synthase
VPVVQAPTTLVAQVDSAYGGKTGVDLPGGKNYAGAYHLPAAVVADTSTLATLSRGGSGRRLRRGIEDRSAGGRRPFGSGCSESRTLDPTDLDDVVFACARYKCEVVAADERDGGLRHVLNLGHTVGHALEAVTGFSEYRHGDAVGLVFWRRCASPMPRPCATRSRRSWSGIELPVRLDPAIDINAVIEALGRDKKRTAAGVGFVLLSAPGEPRAGELIDPARVRAAVEELLG